MARRAPPGYGRNRRLPIGVKLWAAVVAANVIGAAVAVFATAAIRAVPETDGTETALRVAYFGSMLVVGLVDALWLDEAAFKGAFRITHLGGKTADIARRQGDVGAMAVTLQRSTMTFPLSVVAFTVGTYFLFNLVNHDFDRYDKWVGRHVSALRGDDPESMPRRFDAIDALSLRREKEVMPHLLRALSREDEVAGWAAWAIGRHRDVEQTRGLIRPLVAASRRGDAALRREALLALGRLQHRGMAGDLQAELTAELDAGGDVDARLVWALGYVQDLSSVPVLERALYHRDEDLARLAAWALAQHRDQRGGRSVVAVLESRLPSAGVPVRCAIVHALGITADEASNPAVIAAYEASTPSERETICASLPVRLRPDRAGDRQDLLMPTDTLVIKIFETMGQMRASSPEIRAQVEPWLERVIADEGLTNITRESAMSLLDGIRTGRDDAAAARADG